MMVGSRQPRHGIAKAKHLGYVKYYADLADKWLALALEHDSETCLEQALFYEQMSEQHKALAQ
jgi:hypothetical protein